VTTAFERSEKTGRERSESEGRNSAGGRNVTLINNTRRMKVYNLPHDTYCKALGHCECDVIPGREGRRICKSLTLPAGGFQKELPDAVLQLEEILRDISTGAIKAHRIAEPEKKSTPTRKTKSGSGRKRTR